jgi:glycosyltransferase involved in cell wall biosynthesis
VADRTAHPAAQREMSVTGSEIDPGRTDRPSPHGYTVVSRLLWPGTGRVAIEEARRLPARLFVYRQSATPLFYDLKGIDLRYLRLQGERGRLTSLYTALTLLYYSGRGADATVDLDLIARASSKLRGPVLFHDQFAGLTGWLRRLRFQSPYAVYLHETVLGDRSGVRSTKSRWMNLALGAFDRSVLERAQLVLTNSRRNASILREAGIDSRVLYAGCDPLPRLPDRRQPLVLATTVWDHDRNVEAYLELARKSGARVILAGTWGRPEEMERFRRTHGDLIEVTGPLTEQRLDELSRTASVYCRFGFGERGPGQGGIQAMGYGLPVIANREFAMSELIDEGVNGFVVGSVEEAADRVKSLLADDSRRRQMGEAAWLKSRGLSWELHAARLRHLLADHFS